MVASTWDNVRDDKGGGGSGDASSTLRAASWSFSCRNTFICGYLTETRERDTRNSQHKTGLQTKPSQDLNPILAYHHLFRFPHCGVRNRFIGRVDPSV